MKQPSGIEDAVSAAVEKHADMVRRICWMYLKNDADVEDVFQEVFLKLMLNAGTFKDEQHEKAWLCRVAFNKCKDLCKSFWRKQVVSIEEMAIPCEDREQNGLMQAVLQLPPEYRQLIYLHYYEGRSIPEIARIMNRNVNTVYSQLRRANARLRKKMGDSDGRNV